MAKASDFWKQEKQINKTLLLDFSNLAFSSYHGSVGVKNSNDEDKVAMWRFFLFNSLLKIKTKFKPDEFIICLDGGSWRKRIFPLYKAKRTIDREKSAIDFTKFYEQVNSFIDDLKVFPFVQINVREAEGDDVIAILTEELHNKRREILIVSIDKDFQQLQRYLNVKQWNPIKDKFLDCDNPYQFLSDHIIHGDSGDGVPNLLSDDDSILAEDKRQRKITQKVLREINEKGIDQFVLEHALLDKYTRNKTLIELSMECIPKDIQEKVLYEYRNATVTSNYMDVIGVLRKYNIKSLIDKVDGFLS